MLCRSSAYKHRVTQPNTAASPAGRSPSQPVQAQISSTGHYLITFAMTYLTRTIGSQTEMANRKPRCDKTTSEEPLEDRSFCRTSVTVARVGTTGETVHS